MKAEKYKFEIEASLLENVVQEGIAQFDAKNFGLIRDFLDDEHKQLRREDIKKTNKADYVGLRRFLFTAINNLVEMDNTVRTTLFDKMKSDIDNLYIGYDEFASKIKFPDIVYKEQFLPLIPVYQEVATKLQEAIENKEHYQTLETQTKATIDLIEAQETVSPSDMEQLKIARKQNADALHYLAISRDATNELYEQHKALNDYIYNVFIPFFKSNSESMLKDLIALINIKSYCLDQALWYYAEKSIPIQRFFKNAAIVGNFSLKTYIGYYLKNLDPNAGKKNDEIKFLSQAMRDLE